MSLIIQRRIGGIALPVLDSTLFPARLFLSCC